MAYEDGFVAVDHSFLISGDYTLEERLVLIWLASKPADWDVRVDQLRAELRMSTSAARRITRNLREKGAITAPDPKQHPNGQWTREAGRLAIRDQVRHTFPQVAPKAENRTSVNRTSVTERSVFGTSTNDSEQTKVNKGEGEERLDECSPASADSPLVSTSTVGSVSPHDLAPSPARREPTFAELRARALARDAQVQAERGFDPTPTPQPAQPQPEDVEELTAAIADTAPADNPEPEFCDCKCSACFRHNQRGGGTHKYHGRCPWNGNRSYEIDV